MNRRTFVQQCTFLTAAGSTTAIAGDALGSGVRRLSKEKNFTVYSAGLDPAYKVAIGEVVLVECQHGLPGLVTRDGTFREAKEGDPVNPGTGPISVQGIEPGDAIAMDILDIRVADWGYSGGRIFELSNGYAAFDKGLRLPLQPMIGQIGIAPASGQMDTKTPADTGGNMDCREGRAVSTQRLTAQFG